MFREDQVCSAHVMRRTGGLYLVRNLATAVPQHIACKASFAGSVYNCGKEGPGFREVKKWP